MLQQPFNTIKTFSFESYVLRGRSEREIAVEVTYTVNPMDPRSVELLSVTFDSDDHITLTKDEWWTLTDQACDRSAEDLGEYFAELEEQREELMIAARGGLV